MDQNNNKISFICFSVNDNPLEQKRVTFSLSSLLNQTYKNFEIVFIDCSESDKLFNIPHSDKIIHIPFNDMPIFHPTYIRNIGVLKSNGQFLAHVNTDNVYSQHMAQLIVDTLTLNPNILLQCKKKFTTKNQFEKLNTIEDCYNMAAKLKRTMGGAGDFQCLTKEIFMKLDGYFGMIKNGEIHLSTIIEKNAFQEDCWLSVMADRQMYDLSKIYLSGKDPMYWLMHLWHSKRGKKIQWEKLPYGHKKMRKRF